MQDQTLWIDSKGPPSFNGKELINQEVAVAHILCLFPHATLFPCAAQNMLWNVDIGVTLKVNLLVLLVLILQSKQ